MKETEISANYAWWSKYEIIKYKNMKETIKQMFLYDIACHWFFVLSFPFQCSKCIKKRDRQKERKKRKESSLFYERPIKRFTLSESTTKNVWWPIQHVKNLHHTTTTTATKMSLQLWNSSTASHLNLWTSLL